jgi:hypothetical protein
LFHLPKPLEKSSEKYADVELVVVVVGVVVVVVVDEVLGVVVVVVDDAVVVVVDEEVVVPAVAVVVEVGPPLTWGAVATTGVWFDAAIEVPFLFVAVTTARRVDPTSLMTSR